MHRTIQALFTTLIPVFVLGCSANQTRTTPADGYRDRARPVAILNGEPVPQQQIHASLSEYGGDEILRELALDRALEQRCAAQGIEINNNLLAQEREYLSETLGFNSGQPLSTDVLDSIRVERGLGPVRFERLLRRSAMLRALVRDQEPTETQVERSIQAAYGVRYRARLFVSNSPESAHAMRDQTMAGSTDAQPWIFADGCSRSSVHPSAPRGGLIEMLSPVSFGYPAAILSALESTPVGTCSDVISTESGYAVVFVDAVLPERAVTDTQRNRVITRLRSDNQRVSMQRLAAEILEDQELIVMDRALNWAWTNQR